MQKSQEWADRALRKKAIALLPWNLQLWITDHKSAVCSNRDIDREPPDTLGLVTANPRERSAKLLSGGMDGWSKKYHHWSAFSRNEIRKSPAA